MKKDLLNSSSLYDFLCNNGYAMSKNDLIALAKEAICVADNDQAIKNNLVDWCGWDVDED